MAAFVSLQFALPALNKIVHTPKPSTWWHNEMSEATVFNLKHSFVILHFLFIFIYGVAFTEGCVSVSWSYWVEYPYVK